MAAQAAVKAVPASAHVYDVAISFLVADEGIATSIKAGLGGLNVFFYPHKQEELIGTNGLETMRAPFLSARVNVILFRERYGNTPWTGVELSAIQDSCLQSRYESLVFVQLDRKDAKPDWLPNTHIRCVLGDFTIEQLVGAIKNKVQERGGTLRRADAMTEAKRVQREAIYLEDRDRLMRDQRWISEVVHGGIRRSIVEIRRLADEAKSSLGLQIEHGGADKSCVLRFGQVSMAIGWHQPIFNLVSDYGSDQCFLRATEFSGALALPGESRWYTEQPCLLKEHRFRVDISETRDLVWKEAGQSEVIEANRLADRVMSLFLNLMSRANQGQIEAPGR